MSRIRMLKDGTNEIGARVCRVASLEDQLTKGRSISATPSCRSSGTGDTSSGDSLH